MIKGDKMKKLYLLIFILNVIFISKSFSKHCTYERSEKELCESECKDQCIASFNEQTFTCNKC